MQCIILKVFDLRCEIHREYKTIDEGIFQFDVHMRASCIYSLQNVLEKFPNLNVDKAGICTFCKGDQQYSGPNNMDTGPILFELALIKINTYK